MREPTVWSFWRVFLSVFDYAGPVQTGLRSVFGADVWVPELRSLAGAIVVLSLTLFPSFINMLPEGFNKHLICQSLKIDEDDYFGLLLTVAEYDTIGAVTVKRTAESA